MSCTLTSFCLLLVALVGACHAVFYTKSKEVDYPRIGRRSFYTSGRGNNYPRIGRRNGISDSQTSPLFSDDTLSPESFQSKRGFYTKSDRFRSYPRVGRRSQGGNEDGLPEEEGSSADFMDDQRMQSEAENDSKTLRVPLEFLFLAYDNNGDGQLSKSEFVSGMTHYRQRNPLC